jgi:biotin carboxyl carrier protein
MNVDRIEKLVRLFGASSAGGLVVEADGWRLSVCRGGVTVPQPPPPRYASQAAVETEIEEATPPGVIIPAPVVGIFRQGEKVIHVGDGVAAGQTIGSIESMKFLNPVVAEVGGEVLEVLIEDGVPVEYGQHLYRVWPVAAANGEEEEQWSEEEDGRAGR